MSGLLSRVGAFFFEADAPAPAGPHAPAPPRSAAESAAVLGSPASVVALAAACAGELRARSRAAAALL
jgi:hypothetical protein